MEINIKRKKNSHRIPLLNPFPVTCIDSNAQKFTGFFTGLNVQIFDLTEIKTIHENGCFGISSKTKSTPMCLWPSIQPSQINVITVEQERNQKIANKVAHKTLPEIVDKMNKFDTSVLDESLLLFLEEAFFLHYCLKCLQIFDINLDNSSPLNTEIIFKQFCNRKSNFYEHFIAYKYLRSKNWIVKSGLKFGGDFLLYKNGPRYSHASFIVVIKESNKTGQHSLIPCDMHGLYRISENSKKELLIVDVSIPSNVDQSKPECCLANLDKCTVSEISPKRLNVNQEI